MLRILEEAVRAFEERMDDVKEMNIICTYSKCVTERDGQKMDKVRLQYTLGVSKFDIGLGVERTYTSFTSVPYRGSKFLLSGVSKHSMPGQIFVN